MLTVDDLFRLEQIGWYFGGPFSFSPDGKILAYVVQRAKETATLHKQDFLGGNDRADIWLVDIPSGTPRNLTNGVSEGAGYWAPAWSPDGQCLAMLSTRGDNVTLWSWDKSTGQLRQLTQRGVALNYELTQPFIWISSDKILCPVLPEGEKPDVMTIEMRLAQTAMQVWPKAWRGQETTVSVLHSGVRFDLSQRPQRQLLLINTINGSSQVIATGLVQALTLSPDKQWVGFLRTVDIYQPEPDVPLEFEDYHRFAVEVVSIQSGTIKILQTDVSRDVLNHSLRWSVDGTELAFIGYEQNRKTPPRIYSLELANGAVHSFGNGRIEPAPLIRHEPQLLWSSLGELIVYAARAGGQVKPSAQSRRDWWVVKRNGCERPLTEGMHQSPEELLAEPGRRSFVGLADGNLWRIRLDGTAPESITETSTSRLTAIVWPGTEMDGDTQVVPKNETEFSRIIVSTQHDELTDFYLIDLTTGQMNLLTKPTPKSVLVGYKPQNETILFSASNNTGTYLWSAHSSFQTLNQILETNTFLRDIVSGQFRLIGYRSLDGEALKAWLLLPPNYQPGQTYPLVTWVYPGSMAEPSPSRFDEISYPGALNLQILAAYGYVVLKPSIPLNPEGGTDEPMLKLTSGVLPAVEQAVMLGVADPDRLFLMGQSFGGYATYGLITQTNRFKAAVALAGISNLISLYGLFDARLRYGKYPHEDLFAAALLESAQLRMGNPPWKDLGRYIRNSPLFTVERVQTPLMIVQGDMDYVPIQQGEEFFMSLYRLGKRAEFVRYWGEGHVLQSPANIKDMWQRIFSWFEEFSEPRTHHD
jgi:dipeptidyl aminopeptidase/acylaminoacyl peptidase